MTAPLSRRQLLSAAAAAGIAAPALGAKAEPIAKTGAGRVRGRFDSGIAAFKGIRYGADTGPRRFRPPAMPKPWSGVRDALAYGPSCPQTGDGEARMSEDCLFLNVWTPALRDGGKRPVMVYFHGGAYAHGSGTSPLYDGVNLCKRGNVVVVTVNHRLNAFGYLYLGPEGGETYADSGNAGQHDLIQALRWVRDNIAEFGGDPNCVMLFGQSGGGAKIATLMAMPAAAGLFHRAATMSGQQVTACGPLNGIARGKAFLKAAGLDIKDLAQASLERILQGVQARDPINPLHGLYFGPVLDFRSLPCHPFFPEAAEQSRHIPMMIGNTRDETRAFIRDDWAYHLSWDELAKRLPAQLRIDTLPEQVIAAYRDMFPGITASDLFFKATTAGRSWRGAIEEVQARARAGCPAFAYQVDWGMPGRDGKLYAPHGIDIPLAFDNTDKPGAVTGNRETARAMAAIVSESFIAFARGGNPNNDLLPVWTPYSLKNRETMIFDLPPRAENDPRGAERRLFEKIPFIQWGT